jgi:photosystem II stability/assembly factor-like uncharacterized protein
MSLAQLASAAVVGLAAASPVVAYASGAQWSIDSTTSATYLMGVGAGGPKNAVGAAAINGYGCVVEHYDGNAWAKTKISSLMSLDVAVLGSGATVSTGTSQVLVSADGKNYTVVDGLIGACQSANVYGSNSDKFALVGSWAVPDPVTGRPVPNYGVATSSDEGKTFTMSASVPAGSVRYGAFPSESTWFISSGMWGADPAVSSPWGSTLLSRRVSVDVTKGTHHFNGVNGSPKQKLSTGETGWFGAVSKTTDGGKTWTKVLETNLFEDYLYFNAISCASEQNCVVIAEGDDSTGAYRTAAYTTFDGGNTWAKTFESSELVSLMGFKFASPDEGWMLGTAKVGRMLTGMFYRTTDGGKTFELYQSLDNCLGSDVDFAEGAGFAACCASSGSSCSVALLK